MYCPSSKDEHDYLVPGLDALISEPALIEMNPESDHEKIQAKCKRLFIPEFYMDQLKIFGREHDYTARGKNSPVLLDNINKILAMSRKNGYATFYNGMEAQVIPYRNDPTDPRFDPTSSTQQAIKTAEYLVSGESDNILLPSGYKPLSRSTVAMLTGDPYLSGKTHMKRIHVAFISNELYTGRRLLKLPIEASNLWCSNHKITLQEFADIFPDEPALKPQEFVEFTGDYHPLNYDPTFKNVGRMDPQTNAIIPLKYREITGNNTPKHITPRTAGQAMMIEAMMLPTEEAPIVIVMGALGTGKTFLSAGFSYYVGFLNENSPYERTFIVPHDPALGADTGFLPGDATSKARANAMSFEDNMIEIIQHYYSSGNKLGSYQRAKKEFEDKIEEGLIAYDSIVRMGGRTLPNTFYLIDEAQDTERFQIKQLVGRTGDYSKVVVAGDPTQVTNRHLTPDNNGLVHAAAKLADHPNVVVVSFRVPDEVTRSLAARIAAQFL
ncbi:PhoH family protein [Candidatus Saccharibacteria bacterium]|nr:PhoH family protein [Candidatus Saccharibacteria bacterium]